MRIFSSFHRGNIRPGPHTARIAARSSEVPSRSITYTVDIDTPGGVITFEGVAPQESSRWLNFDGLNLVPFPIGHLVTVHVIGREGSYAAVIESAEKPDAGPCPQGA